MLTRFSYHYVVAQNLLPVFGGKGQPLTLKALTETQAYQKIQQERDESLMGHVKKALTIQQGWLSIFVAGDDHARALAKKMGEENENPSLLILSTKR